MQSLQARVDSFQKTRRVKRYPNRPSSSAANVRWPHPPKFKANANTLAEAGFFFEPSWAERDSVACFLCGKQLSDWDADDDPFEIHYTKCRSSCAWALVRCGLTEDMDDDGGFAFENKTRLPSSKAMEKARLNTFGEDWWPHDDEPGHCATSLKMAQAGFVYTPQVAGDDTVTCLYCNLSLGGWEKEDDPIQEHRKRDDKSGPGCPFFVFSPKHARSKPTKPTLPAKSRPSLDEVEQQSGDESAAHVADPPPRPKRGKARSTTSTAPTKSRRKTRATRGKPKPSAPVSRHSPSPSQTVSHEPGDVATLDAPMDVDVSPIPQPPSPMNESQNNDFTSPNGVIHHPVGTASPPEPGAPNQSAPIMSLSPAGQPVAVNSPLLTSQERTMSLEQWIRQEIDLSYDRLLADGRQQIEVFKTKAVELRKCIDEL